MVGRLEYRKRDDHNGYMRTGSGIALASAYGDALGAPYEFIPVVMPPDPVVMTSNGTWARGEWTDDTAMSVPILEASALGLDLSSPEAQGYIFRRWMDWALVTKDIGNQTSRVIRNVRARILPAHDDARVADTARYYAAQVYERSGSKGNGSLMRTHAVAIALRDRADEEIAAVARSISALTHPGEECEEACVIWAVGIVHALRGEVAIEAGLAQIPEKSRERWLSILNDDADRDLMPWDFENSGYVVDALRAAWSAVSAADDTRSCIDLAVRTDDSDTVAAIAGAFAGALWGTDSLPADEVSILHGYPDLGGADLADLAERARA